MKTLAIFDIDGTLTSVHSLETQLISALWQHHAVSAVKQLVRWPKGIWRARGTDYPFLRNKSYLQNISKEELDRWIDQWIAPRLPEFLNPTGVALLREAQKAPDTTVVLLSGTLLQLAQSVARHFGVQYVIATVPEENADHYTGQTVGIFPRGKGKAKLVQQFQQMHQLTDAQIEAYGDHFGDRHVLALANVAHAVNPDRKLRRYAQQQGWIIHDDARPTASAKTR